jgi:hypothetical protein
VRLWNTYSIGYKKRQHMDLGQTLHKIPMFVLHCLSFGVAPPQPMPALGMQMPCSLRPRSSCLAACALKHHCTTSIEVTGFIRVRAVHTSFNLHSTLGVLVVAEPPNLNRLRSTCSSLIKVIKSMLLKRYKSGSS